MLCSTCLAENPDHVTECITCGAPLDDWEDTDDNPTMVSSSLLHLQAGSLLKNGDYEIQSLLGQGGFGITYKGIYKANNSQLEVAIKELWPEQAARQKTTVLWSPTITQQQQREQIQAFFAEAYNQYQCKHPNIAQVYDWFEENNTAYIIMQFISGKSLFKILKEAGILDENKVKKYFLQIAEALKVVHLQNFQHRDIKPENILIDGQDNAILIDFGAAREFIAGQTREMTRIVTPGYAPFEQYSLTSKRYPATDFYAFCASIYELLTGQLPVDAVQRSTPPDSLIPPRQLNPNISELMEQVILIGLKMNVKERFQIADDLIDALNGNLISPSQKEAKSLVKAGKLSEASRAYQRCLREDSNNKNTALEYALLSIYLNDAQAETAAQTAIQLNPNDGRGYGILGLVNCRQGNWLEAVKNLQKAVNLCPDQVWILANYAWSLGKTNNWGQAEVFVKKALEIDENCSFALGIQAWILFQQHKYKPQRVNEPAVIPCATKAIYQESLNQNQEIQRWVYPYLITALSRVTHKITGGSLNNHIEKCLQQNPDHSFVLGYKGWQKVKLGQLVEAIAYFQQASQYPNPQAWVLINTAIAHEYANNITEAAQMYEICIQKIAQFPFLHYRLGTILGRNQQWEQAKQQLEQAIALNTDYAEAYHNLGWVLFHRRKPDGEIQDVQGVLGAYKKAFYYYRQQNRSDLAQSLENLFKDAGIPF